MAASRCLCSVLKASKFINKTIKFPPVRGLYSNYRRLEHVQNVYINRLATGYRFSTCGSLFGDMKQSAANQKLEGSTSSPPEQDASKGKDEKEKEERAKADAYAMKTMKYTFYFLGVFFVGTTGMLIHDWGAPLEDEQGNEIKDEYSDYPPWKAYILRFWRELIFYNQMIKEPSRRKLLPDPLTEPYYQPRYTLVLEMTGVLVHPDWTYNTGWRFKKRPGVDYFLNQVAPPLFEVVVYTSEQGFTAFPIIESLDPNGFIMYKLFRDATRYHNGHHIKDLDCLNRDLSKVILVDWNEQSFELHPRNAFKLSRWKGEDEDRTLVDLAAFLKTVASSDVEDVRTVLDHYNQFDDPIQAFKDNQKKLQEDEDQKRIHQKSEQKDKSGILALNTWPAPLQLRRS